MSVLSEREVKGGAVVTGYQIYHGERWLFVGMVDRRGEHIKLTVYAPATMMTGQLETETWTIYLYRDEVYSVRLR